MLQPGVSHVAIAVAPDASTNRRLERFAILLNSLLNQHALPRMSLMESVRYLGVESALDI